MRIDNDELIEVDHVDVKAFEGECENPLSLFYLSSEECCDAPSVDADLPMDAAKGLRKQATTHINVTNEDVPKSIGEDRQKWLEAGKKEISNLTTKNRMITRSER